VKITFPSMGNIFIPTKVLLDELGFEYIVPYPNNKEVLELGMMHCPEMVCIPLKYNIGNYILARKSGADAVLVAGGCGPCRFGYYGEMSKGILKEAGYEMDIITLEVGDKGIMEFLSSFKKYNRKLTNLKVLSSFYKAYCISKKVDMLENKFLKKLAANKDKDYCIKIFEDMKARVMKLKGYREIDRLLDITFKKINNLENSSEIVLRVGIVGEIYTTNDEFASFNIAKLLAKMGVETDKYVTVSGFVREHIIKNGLKIPGEIRLKRAAKGYIDEMIGGHAQETVGNAVVYSNRNYDGIIQIFPLGCMPEIVAKGVLEKIKKDKDIPILYIVVDEMTGEAGMLTRIEAFVDLMKKRREVKDECRMNII